MSKLFALFDLFRKGSAVTDPALWKGRQIAVTALLPFFAALVATARAFGHELPINDEQVAQVVAGLVVVINLVLTVTTSKKVGLPAKPAADSDHECDPGPP